MKKIVLLSILFIAAFIAQSCQKHEEDVLVKKSVDITLKAGETYTYILPAYTSDDPYQITKTPSFASISELSKDALGNDVYKYSAVSGFCGKDVVVIENVEETHPNGGGQCGFGNSSQQGQGCFGGGNGNHHKGGQCGKHEEINNQVTLNIVVQCENTISTR